MTLLHTHSSEQACRTGTHQIKEMASSNSSGPAECVGSAEQVWQIPVVDNTLLQKPTLLILLPYPSLTLPHQAPNTALNTPLPRLCCVCLCVCLCVRVIECEAALTSLYNPTDWMASTTLADTHKTDHPDWRKHQEIRSDSQQPQPIRLQKQQGSCWVSRNEVDYGLKWKDFIS